jgi:hypothetical protein
MGQDGIPVSIGIIIGAVLLGGMIIAGLITAAVIQMG